MRRRLSVSGYYLQPAGGSVKLWDAEAGKESLELANSQKHVAGVAFSPDGRTVANAVTDNTVKLWNVSDSMTTR